MDQNLKHDSSVTSCSEQIIIINQLLSPKILNLKFFKAHLQISLHHTKVRNKAKKESHSSSDVLQRQHLMKNEKRMER